MHRSLLVVLVSSLALLVAAPATALAAPPSGNDGSSNWQWVTGLVVLLVLAVVGLVVRLRRR